MDNANVSQMSDCMDQLHIGRSFMSQTNNNNCDNAEEAIVTDSSEEYLSESLRYYNRNSHYQLERSISSTNSDQTVVPDENDPFYLNSFNRDVDLKNIQVPIVGYEIMEERARFTVFKLRIDNKVSGDSWYVFRRYTDFVRLCNKLRTSYSEIAKQLPRKRWLGNNFDPIFLEERVSGLQTLVNAILSDSDLIKSQEIQDFFCLNEPPIYSETNEESRAIFEALEETINDLKQQLNEKEKMIDSLQDILHSKAVENENLRKMVKSSTTNCQTD